MKIKPINSITKNILSFKYLAIFLIICQVSLLFINISHQLKNHSHQNQYQIKSDFDSKKNQKDHHHCFICFLNQFLDYLILNDILFLFLALVFIKYLANNFLNLNLPKLKKVNTQRAPPIFV